MSSVCSVSTSTLPVSLFQCLFSIYTAVLYCLPFTSLPYVVTSQYALCYTDVINSWFEVVSHLRYHFIDVITLHICYHVIVWRYVTQSLSFHGLTLCYTDVIISQWGAMLHIHNHFKVGRYVIQPLSFQSLTLRYTDVIIHSLTLCYTGVKNPQSVAILHRCYHSTVWIYVTQTLPVHSLALCYTDVIISQSDAIRSSSSYCTALADFFFARLLLRSGSLLLRGLGSRASVSRRSLKSKKRFPLQQLKTAFWFW